MTYKQYMTQEFDMQFGKAKSFRWYPWVGDEYSKTGIFVLGHTTRWDCSDPSVSRQLVAWENPKTGKIFDYENTDRKYARSFKLFSDMFLNENKCDRAKFWRSVAFNNFCQCPVNGIYDSCGCLEDSILAYRKTIDILAPKMILVWGMKSIYHITAENDVVKCEMINGAYPRVVLGKTPIVCIQHPSRISGADWLNFLRHESPSKIGRDAIESLASHLRIIMPDDI